MGYSKNSIQNSAFDAGEGAVQCLGSNSIQAHELPLSFSHAHRTAYFLISLKHPLFKGSVLK